MPRVLFAIQFIQILNALRLHKDSQEKAVFRLPQAAKTYDIDEQRSVEFNCPCCSEIFPSRNRLYDHMRKSSSCCQSSSSFGYDLTRNQRRVQVALLITYPPCLNNASSTSNIMKSVLSSSSYDLDKKLSFTRATDSSYRLSNLFDQEPCVSAAGDVVIFSELEGAVDEGGDQSWIKYINSKLRESNISVLARDIIVNSSLHAEKDCTARIYEYILPKYIIFPDKALEYKSNVCDVENAHSDFSPTDFGINATAGVAESLENNEHDYDPERGSYMSLKQTLRSLSSRKLDRMGGYKYRRSVVQQDIRQQQRWHNYCGDTSLRVVPTDAAVKRIVDKFVAKDLTVDGRQYLSLRVTGDGFLSQQVRRMAGTCVCIMRGLLPPSFASLSLDPAVLIETPCAPASHFLREVRYDWYYQNGLFEGSKEAHLARIRSIAEDIVRREGYEEIFASWLVEMENTVCPRIRAQMVRVMAQNDMPGTADAGERNSDVNIVCDQSSVPPTPYEKVLRLLREADKSGKWPQTSVARSRVLAVPDDHQKGSFSVGRPVSGSRAPVGNGIFEELTAAVFALERVITPDREPSTMVAINRHATFLPHTDAGAGYGQSTSLIVGLGDYSGGALCVEGQAHDIRYRPLSFDGWRERHWTLPFQGERYSLVWFTPLEQSSASSSDRYAGLN